MNHTATHCHCAADRQGSDHCPECGCEEYESTCDHQHFSVDLVDMSSTPDGKMRGLWLIAALRITLDEARLMEYDDADQLYNHLNEAESLLFDRNPADDRRNA